jgi:glycerol kinase
MSVDHILAIDQGTTSTRALIYDRSLRIVASAQRELSLSYPKPGWVEHNPKELLVSVDEVVAEAIGLSKVGPNRIAAIGLTNQRETTIVWSRETGEAIGPAIVWQDRRTADFCERRAGHRAWIARHTGLVLDAYFSATKIAWLLDHMPDARRRAEAGDLAAGTVDSWLIWHLTGGQVHATDVTNASRTLLMELDKGSWGDDLCDFFAIPQRILPKIVASTGLFGTTQGNKQIPANLPIGGVAGDQQASLVGQGCVSSGQAKCTYGTGAFLLLHTGSARVHSSKGLISTAAASLSDSQPQFALEGSVFVAGAAVQWFRDGLQAIGAAPEIDLLYELGRDQSGIVFVPALTGLGAPHWSPHARGTIFGITRDTSVADLARATIEGVAFQVADLLEAARNDSPNALTGLRVDGGMARSDPFLQFQADILGIPLLRSPHTESTALGAALLAGLSAGVWPDHESALQQLPSLTRSFEPRRDERWRSEKMSHWRKAVDSVLRHYES